MNIIAIDPGIKTGWASLSDGKLESGVQEFSTGRGESPGMRFLRFRSWLVQMLDLVKPGLVVYELPFVRIGFASAEFLSGLTSRIQEECAARGIEYQPVNPMTLKKKVCGTGKADKTSMILRANQNWGQKVIYDDEADALCLLTYAIDEHGVNKSGEGK